MSHNHSQRHVETIENLNSPNIGLTCADPDAGFYHDILPEFNAEIGFSVSPLAALSDWTESFQDVGVSQSQQLNGASPASAHAGNLEFEVLTGNGTPASDSASTSLAKISRSSVTPVWIGHTIRYGDSEAEVATSGSAKNVPNATDGKPLRIEQFNPGLGASRKRKTHRASRSDVLKHDKNPKAITKVNKIGALQGWFHIFGSNQHVRRRMNKEERTASAVTRILGACDRCRLHKQRCDRSKNLYTPCISCLKMLRAFRASGSLRRLKAVDIYLQPCIRADILGLSLHRINCKQQFSRLDETKKLLPMSTFH
ncbi:hypothetical protein F5Y19DRAFT_227127 [Xylariaceae sp. FL1651]|nr:hypothetical protein F5Y19DRAFT_227127 [Xylariaceae sp. FL1651]